MKLATKFCTSPNWSWTHGIRILEGFADVPKPHVCMRILVACNCISLLMQSE